MEIKKLNDTIYRQDAINALDCINGVEEVLKSLPSAEPERPEQLESAREYCAECDHIEMCRWYPYEGCEFRSLPSAQPEHPMVDIAKVTMAMAKKADMVAVTRCKDCKHRHLDGMIWSCPFGLSGGEDFFCAYGVKDGD